MNREEYLQNIIKNIPNKPGCYQYYDSNKEIIYIGKAKDLKKRVSSYFNKNQQSFKTKVLVGKIADIKYIIVNNEAETLLLENNLIKQYQPRYNILLKDDKTYPSIVVKNEYFPRIFQTRNLLKDKSRYFGPYTNLGSMKTVLQMIQKLYKIRTCNLDLSPEKIKEGKYKVCLQYHIKNCLGPCVGKQSLEDYNKDINSAVEILKGNTKEVRDIIFKEMQALAEENKFEEAEILKHKYILINEYIAKTTVDGNYDYNLEVYSYVEDDNLKSAYINFLNVKNGSIIQGYTFEIKRKLEESKEELLGIAINEMRQRFSLNSKEIVVPFYPTFDDFDLEEVEFSIPQKGGKMKLLELSLKNAKQFKIDKLKRAETLNPEQRQTRILKEVEKSLHLKELPIHIECFDNSNFHGTNAVSACVVFKKGKPSKKDYRIFNVKTVEGPDDYSTMEEVLTRRYSRLIDEKSPLPQLVIIDGGKGQLGVAVEVFTKLGIYGKVALIGLAEKLEEIYFPGDTIPLYLDKNSEALKLIIYLRDEAHRFGLKHHRNKRSKTQVTSELDTIKGIGTETKKLLLKELKSIKRIKEARIEILENLVGKHKAKLIFDHFQKSDI